MRSTMMKWWALMAVVALGTLLPPEAVHAEPVDFENLYLSPESQWDGVDTTYDNGSGDYNTFNSGGATFNNYHEWHDPWGYGPMHYWDGWAYSNRTDTNSTGVAGQYTAMANPAGGQGGSSNYGVAYLGWGGRVPIASFASPSVVESAYFTNNAYAHDSMLNGDSFAKKFGGDTGDDEDWFLLTITGKDALGTSTGTVEFYLADYRFDNNSQDYIIDDWTLADLTGLGEVSSLEFGLTSSDVGDWGMNTPAYFAMDSLAPVPEPSTVALLLIAAAAGLIPRRRRK